MKKPVLLFVGLVFCLQIFIVGCVNNMESGSVIGQLGIVTSELKSARSFGVKEKNIAYQLLEEFNQYKNLSIPDVESRFRNDLETLVAVLEKQNADDINSAATSMHESSIIFEKEMRKEILDIDAKKERELQEARTKAEQEVNKAENLLKEYSKHKFPSMADYEVQLQSDLSTLNDISFSKHLETINSALDRLHASSTSFETEMRKQIEQERELQEARTKAEQEVGKSEDLLKEYSKHKFPSMADHEVQLQSDLSVLNAVMLSNNSDSIIAASDKLHVSSTSFETEMKRKNAGPRAKNEKMRAETLLEEYSKHKSLSMTAYEKKLRNDLSELNEVISLKNTDSIIAASDKLDASSTSFETEMRKQIKILEEKRAEEEKRKAVARASAEKEKRYGPAVAEIKKILKHLVNNGALFIDPDKLVYEYTPSEDGKNYVVISGELTLTMNSVGNISLFSDKNALLKARAYYEQMGSFSDSFVNVSKNGNILLTSFSTEPLLLNKALYRLIIAFETY
ncbi:MAG TPA: hypothetical protein PKZ42_08325 [Syntrophales bacterium]|nr:hypothetical protein [Syntrophales bacterium]